jgi:Cu-Zn family superoxide dismutase
MSKIALIAAALALLALPAAGQEGGATATLMDQSGTNLGTLTLADMDGGVHITGELTGVPNGEHGFHIHETGTCDAATQFESAGAHFEPGDKKHGKDNPEGPHAGDLLNVTANDDGVLMVDEHNPNVTVEALLDEDGAAIVLHADPDDYKTDPSGNSGDRFACGVIDGAR